MKIEGEIEISSEAPMSDELYDFKTTTGVLQYKKDCEILISNLLNNFEANTRLTPTTLFCSQNAEGRIVAQFNLKS